MIMMMIGYETKKNKRERDITHIIIFQREGYIIGFISYAQRESIILKTSLFFRLDFFHLVILPVLIGRSRTEPNHHAFPSPVHNLPRNRSEITYSYPPINK